MATTRVTSGFAYELTGVVPFLFTMRQEFEYEDYDQAEAHYRRALALAPSDVTLVYDLAVFLHQRRYVRR